MQEVLAKSVFLCNNSNVTILSIYTIYSMLGSYHPMGFTTIKFLVLILVLVLVLTVIEMGGLAKAGLCKGPSSTGYEMNLLLLLLI